MASSARKKSPIWSLFSVADDSKFAVCSICGQKVSCGAINRENF